MGSSSLLGPDHPLARAESRQRLLLGQFAVTVVLGAAAVVLSPVLGQAAVRLAFGAGVVAALLVAALLILRTSLRERALELIVNGREDLPLPVVRNESARLRDRRYRRSLARTLEVISVQPDQREWWAPIYADQVSVRHARAELEEIARLLRELPSVRARGVALVTRLIRDGATSPLYRGPAPQLREELGRIRHVLIQA